MRCTTITAAHPIHRGIDGTLGRPTPTATRAGQVAQPELSVLRATLMRSEGSGMTSEMWTRPRLLTVAEYLEIGEIETGYAELVEGRVVMSPNPLADHNWAAAELRDQLRPQLPPDLEILLDVDVDLQLAPPDAPGSCRRPDLVVLRREARLRQRRDGGLIRASDVVVVAEVLSPGSRRTDHVAKRSDYADAGIPHYWVLDPAAPVSLLACHLAGEFGYADRGAVTGRFTTTEPFPAEIDLPALL